MQNIDRTVSNFFVAGGTLPPNSPSYVQRPADTELFEAILTGQFCYVLTPRQMGKSSLMVRTARRLTSKGVRTAIIDLTRMGTGITIEQWYLGLLTRLKSQLRLTTNVEDWWQARSNLGPVQRFNDFLHDVVLAEIQGPVAIFIDEIDSTLSLDFTDDFFAVIRAVYNSRATEIVYERLTFVFLGVATPADLIIDRNRTPFNIGRRINLREFGRSDAQVLLDGIKAHLPEQGEAVFDRIFHWTNGQPYFTQKLCLAVIESKCQDWNDSEVDKLVNKFFLSDEAKRETNLQFIRENVNASSRKGDLLRLYRQVYHGKRVVEDERSLVQNYLKLYGLLQTDGGNLTIRNEIYRHAFNEVWINENMPADWARRVVFIGVVVILILIGSLAYYFWQQDRRATETLAEQAISTFQNNDNPSLRLNSLNELFALENYHEEARRLFLGLTEAEQMELFSEEETSELTVQRYNVISGTYVIINSTQNELLATMHDALIGAEDADSQLLREEIDRWEKGREAYGEGNLEEAIDWFNSAVDLNDANPAIRYELALAYIEEVEYGSALDQLNAILLLNLDQDVNLLWQSRIKQTFQSNPALYNRWREQRATYDALSDVVPTPTRSTD